MQHSDELLPPKASDGSNDDLNLVKRVKKNKMVEVIYKGKTTTWMQNIVMPILQELNPRVTDWSLVPPIYDV